MKPIEGFKTEAPRTGYEMLPKGLYIGQVKGVKLEGKEPDQQLVIRLDITEGEYAGYYTKRYNTEKDAGGRYEVRYKGDYYLQIPNQDNKKREHYDWDYKAFNGAIWAFEDSNDGYHWDWKETSLKGLTIGLNVREGTFNGSPYTRIGRLESVKMIRAGKVKVMKDIPPRNTAEATVTTSATVPGFTLVEDEEIPF